MPIEVIVCETCRRPCVVHIRSPGRMGYVLG